MRVSIGWHYLYEGAHKLNPHHEFSSESFLAIAKGPTAEFYYTFLPDINGIERLVVEDVFNKSGKVDGKKFPVYEEAWERWREEFENKYFMNDTQLAALDEADAADAIALYDRQRKEMDELYKLYLRSLRNGAKEVEESIEQYKGALERNREARHSRANKAIFQQERDWNEMLKLRSEARGWINEFDAMNKGLENGFWRILTDTQKAYGPAPEIVTKPEMVWIPNPVTNSQIKALDLSVTYGLTAIGFCLLVGLCTRLAALGAIVFLTNVLMTTLPIASVHPVMPDMVGHFLFVSKDFIELVALLVIVALPVGRWGGLDYFLWNWIGKKYCKKEEKKA